MRKRRHRNLHTTPRTESWKVLFSTLLSVLSITSIQSQAPSSQTKHEIPKLVIGITIDQLRGDYLQYCLSSFGEKGLKRLLNEGLVYQQVQFDYPNLSAASAIATIYTGTNPYYHGITSRTKYDWNLLKEVSIFHDSEFLGNYTTETLSPKNLKSTTIADELKIATNGKGYVFSIAPDAVPAIISGGHAANSSFWLEDYTGKWATTTFYKDVPWYVEKYNLSESLDTKIGNLSWTPLLDSYETLPFSKDKKEFKYLFYSKDKFKQIKSSPFVNQEVTDFACRFLQNEQFYHKTYPGLFALTYYAGNYEGALQKDFSEETQDLYYRLDKEIERLLETIEKFVGIKNTLIFLTPTGYYESSENNPDIVQPEGMFYPNRCTALLNMYLMSVYGQGDWVSGYYENQIYLNRKLIDDKQLALSEVQRKAAEFTIQFSGVQDVSTLIETLYGNWNEGVALFRNGINKDISGDIIIELQPGWVLVDEQNPVKNKHVRSNAIAAPLIFLGSQVTPQKIKRVVKATQIAPSVTHVLRIRPPNAAKELPLQEFVLP